MPTLAESLGGAAASEEATGSSNFKGQLSREQELRSRLLASKQKPQSNDTDDASREPLSSRIGRSRSKSASPRSERSRSPRQRRGPPSYEAAAPSSGSSAQPPPRPYTHPDRRPPPPRPQVDRWVPPPREDRGDDDRPYPPRRDGDDRRERDHWGRDRAQRGPPPNSSGGRYLGAGNNDEQDRNGSSEYGAAQWKRLPRDPYASSMSSRPQGGASAGDGGFFRSRDEQRKNSTLSIWPPSPPHPTIDSEQEREREPEKRKRSSRHKDKHRSDKHRHSSSSKSHRHHSSSSRHHHSSRHKDEKESSSSHRHSRSSRSRRDEEERRRRRSKRSRSKVSDNGSGSSGSESDSDDGRRHRHRSSRHHSRNGSDKRHRSGRHRSASVSSSSSDSDADRRRSRSRSKHSASPSKSHRSPSPSSSSSDVQVGPTLPVSSDGKPIDPRSYGSALLPGEGSAMASYVQDGKRIPRRGEIGLTSDQIESFEKAGYVMSGSRHHRMNAVRMRKENQVISAEEKRSMLRLQAEEKAKKEREIVSQFKELVDTLQPPPPSGGKSA
ncbi:hypothetical protein NDA11_001565 [Ustilago hordei]|nr:hypothetical protein NDA12_003588 [Ustilago hordei]KAJ1576277.1 hypothetical protein NDA15_007723 [Ustilago hordei]KAJ1593767.1 hypothetical protein NDA11_001565 [Ustilago hordei]KAJ1595353.1 hypothetical protein NDA14_002594 [Ustilago hordei]UTT89108.1 hypothetical protein NDA17_001853 [Ustilago hordei]